MTERSLLTRKELMLALGCDVRTVAKWQDEGMPVAVIGRGGRPSMFDLADCRAWKQARDLAATAAAAASAAAAGAAGIEGLDLDTERARAARAQAMLAEQKHAINARKLLPAEDVEKAWSAEQSAVRAKLLALPQAFAERMARAVTKKGAAGAEALLRDMVDEVLSELATAERPLKKGK
jgi:phage terminase Nu1 subunit (DNA packaging protein)